MKHMSFADAESADKRKKTRCKRFLMPQTFYDLDASDRALKGLDYLDRAHCPKGKGGRPAYSLMVMWQGSRKN